MKMTTKDYNAMVEGFDRLIPIAEKQFGSVEKYYKTVWLHACKVSDYPKTRYIWDCFWNAKIYFGKNPMNNPVYYNIITDNDYKDSHLETAIKLYLKSKGYNYYDK